MAEHERANAGGVAPKCEVHDIHHQADVFGRIDSRGGADATFPGRGYFCGDSGIKFTKRGEYSRIEIVAGTELFFFMFDPLLD